MLRPSLFVIVLCAMCSAVAFGQTAPPPTPTAHGGSSTREHPAMQSPAAQMAEAQNSASIMQQNGGSLLRASLVAAPDPARAGLKNVSVFSVPEQEAKTVKKHDLITIIIREESEVSSQGTSDLKRQSDIDAKVDAFARLFVIPQANHGLGGNGIPNIYDRVGLLIDWVEHNKAPGKRVTLTGSGRSMPMCSYPAYPKYTGGPTDLAGSYTCS